MTGLTIAFVVESAYLNSLFGYMLGLGSELPVCLAVGFVIAESIVGGWFGGHNAGRTTAA